MPIWSEILREINASETPDFDGVRRKYLAALYEHTNRNVILYASGWLQQDHAPSAVSSIGDEDIHALMEVTNGLRGDSLDLILHSPGGSPKSAEAVVSYLRARFSDIRVIVPQLAMSAATMIACAANRIVLGKHSFLGPTDPQLLIQTSLGFQQVPAQAVLDQFEKALEHGNDPEKFPAWLPMLEQYGPHLLVQCESALGLSRELVRTWLEQYMFKDSPALERKQLAKDISDWLANHQDFKSHSRHIARDELKNQGLVIENLEDDKELEDLSLSVFHAAIHTLTATPTIKICENHVGRAYMKQMQPVQLVGPPQFEQP